MVLNRVSGEADLTKGTLNRWHMFRLIGRSLVYVLVWSFWVFSFMWLLYYLRTSYIRYTVSSSSFLFFFSPFWDLHYPKYLKVIWYFIAVYCPYHIHVVSETTRQEQRIWGSCCSAPSPAGTRNPTHDSPLLCQMYRAHCQNQGPLLLLRRKECIKF